MTKHPLIIALIFSRVCAIAQPTSDGGMITGEEFSDRANTLVDVCVEQIALAENHWYKDHGDFAVGRKGDILETMKREYADDVANVRSGKYPSNYIQSDTSVNGIQEVSENIRQCEQIGMKVRVSHAFVTVWLHQQSAQNAAEKKTVVDAERKKIGENPPAKISYDTRQITPGGAVAVHSAPAGSVRSSTYANFSPWLIKTIQEENAKMNPPLLRSEVETARITGEPYQRFSACKAKVAREWQEAFGYPYTTVSFAFADGNQRQYSRKSVTAMACMENALSLQGFHVSSD